MNTVQIKDVILWPL